MKKSAKKIAVIGATGTLGRPVTRELIDAGYDVSVIARDPEKARRLFPDRPIVQGDILELSSMERALHGQDAVYLSLHVAASERPGDPHPETDGLKNVVAAASLHRLERIAYLSSLAQEYQGQNGFHWWVFDVKREALRILRRSGLPHTVFYPSTFMDNFTHAYRQNNRIVLTGTSKHPMYFIAARDFGKQVARSFAVLKNETRGYVVQGPDSFRQEEAAEIFVQHYRGAPLKIARVPLGVRRGLGVFAAGSRYDARYLEARNNYPEAFQASDTWRALGRPTTTLIEFARQAD